MNTAESILAELDIYTAPLGMVCFLDNDQLQKLIDMSFEIGRRLHNNGITIYVFKDNSKFMINSDNTLVVA